MSWPFFAGADAVILPDNDAPGAKHASFVASKLTGAAHRVRILELPDLPPRGDVADWIKAGGTLERLHELAAKSVDSKLGAESLSQLIQNWLFLSMEFPFWKKSFPPRETILSPWLPEKGLALIFSERGVGKTWIAMNVAG